MLPHYDMVVMAASAGGLHALQTVLSGLPADFPVPIAIVQHRPSSHASILPRILGKHSQLHVKEAVDGEKLQAGTVYVAPPDRHIEIRPDQFITCFDGRKIKFTHSSANPLFESAANVSRHGVIAVVLSGCGSNGADALHAVKAHYGFVIVQDPATAQHSGMPRAAIETGTVDQVLPLEEIAPAIVHAMHARAANSAQS